jgi:hypothetical protein
MISQFKPVSVTTVTSLQTVNRIRFRRFRAHSNMRTICQLACGKGTGVAVVFLFFGLLGGCSRDDSYLHGTWRSDRQATVDAALQRDPRWAKVPLSKFERFTNMFGDMTITYSNRIMIVCDHSSTYALRYKIVRRSPNKVVLRVDEGMDKGRDIHLRFVDQCAAYWVDLGPLGSGLEERFDRVKLITNSERVTH